MDKWHLFVDVALCHNCNNCVLSSIDEHVGNDLPGYSAPHSPQSPTVIRLRRQVRGSGSMVDAAHLPTLCNHCADAPCVKAGGGAVRQRPDGIVIIDPEQARGRRDLLDACPYGAIVWNEERQLPQNWIFDAHLLDQGATVPRCVQACPTGALQAAKLSDSAAAQRVAGDGMEELSPELGTSPRVHYKNLYRFNRCFVGGSVSALVDGAVNCIEGAQVTLHREGSLLATTQTDAFGDFKFDGLASGSGTYAVTVTHAGFAALSVNAILGETQALGELRLG